MVSFNECRLSKQCFGGVDSLVARVVASQAGEAGRREASDQRIRRGGVTCSIAYPQAAIPWLGGNVVGVRQVAFGRR
jgi:hypothetical protein